MRPKLALAPSQALGETHLVCTLVLLEPLERLGRGRLECLVVLGGQLVLEALLLEGVPQAEDVRLEGVTCLDLLRLQLVLLRELLRLLDLVTGTGGVRVRLGTLTGSMRASQSGACMPYSVAIYPLCHTHYAILTMATSVPCARCPSRSAGPSRP